MAAMNLVTMTFSASTECRAGALMLGEAREGKGAWERRGRKDDCVSPCHAHAAGAGFWLAAAYRWRSARRHCSSCSLSEQCMRCRAQRRRRLQNDLSLQQSWTSSSPAESRRRSVFYSFTRAFQPPASSRSRAGPLWMDTEADWRATQSRRFESADVGTIPASNVFIAVCPPADSWSAVLPSLRTNVPLKRRLVDDDDDVYNLRRPGRVSIGSRWRADKMAELWYTSHLLLWIARRHRLNTWPWSTIAARVDRRQ